MGVGPEEYKDALRKFTSGVTIVTAASDSGPHGMTATSFASVSLDPPLILVCLLRDSRTLELIRARNTFAVNILSTDQQQVARAFALPGDKQFESLQYHAGANGAPLLGGALAALECTTTSIERAGDHDIVVAEVTATNVTPGAPLVYHNRDYRALKEN